MRCPALALLTALGCASPPPPPKPPVEERLDPRIAILDELQSVGLPNPLGWTRLEHVEVLGRGENCERSWEQPGSLHHVRMHDDLTVDYDGQWFSQWPAAMRVPQGTYEHAVLRWIRKRPASVAAPKRTRPSSVFREADAYVHSRPRCVGERVLGSELDAVVLATRVRAMGHAELARRIVSHWPPVWDAARLRAVVARAVASSAALSFAQGMPRAAVRALLSRADALCDCCGLPGVRSLLDGLGDDPTGVYDPEDPESLLDWLVDDLVLFGAPQDTLGWREAASPRSPGFELIAMGWAALPAVIARTGDDRWMRTAQNFRVGDVAVVIAAEIARRPFGNADALASWWAEHRDGSEFEAMTANLADRTTAVPALQRLLELDPEHAVSRLVAGWPDLPEPARRGLVDASIHSRRQPATAANLEPLLLVALRGEDLVTASRAAEGFAEGRSRGWVRIAVDRARPLVRGLSPPTRPADAEDDFEDPLTTLIVAVATVDRDAARPLLREALRREGADPRGVGARALALLCASSEEDPTPPCPGWRDLTRSPTRRRSP